MFPKETVDVRPWLSSFIPAPVSVSRREIALSCLGALLGLLAAAWLSQRLLAGLNPWFIAPMGASAVLLFAVPASPLAQPWSIIGGNVVSAAISVTCAQHVPNLALASALAGSIAIGAMFALRRLHPPSGAVALTAVLGGPAVKALGYAFVAWPVALDSLLLLMAALLFSVSTRRRYPHRAPAAAPAHRARDASPSERVGLTLDDLHQALASRGELLDVSEDDLQELFVEAEHRAWKRRFASLRCSEIMSHDVLTAWPSTPARQARQRMIDHAVKALPVIDEAGRLQGIVTLHDFFVGHAMADGVVGDIMTRDVLTATPAQELVALMAAFSGGNRHHLPVVDASGRVVGMLTQSDVVAALLRAGIERPAAPATA